MLDQLLKSLCFDEELPVEFHSILQEIEFALWVYQCQVNSTAVANNLSKQAPEQIF